MKKKEKNKYFFGTNKTQMNIEEYVSQINEISKYYFERCEKYKKDFIDVVLFVFLQQR